MFQPEASSPEGQLKRVGYLSMDSRTGLTRLDQVDASLLTHIILASVHVDPTSGCIMLAKPQDRDYLDQVRLFKQKNPTIRVLVSVNNNQTTGTLSSSSNNNNNTHRHHNTHDDNSNHLNHHHHQHASSRLARSSNHHIQPLNGDDKSDQQHHHSNLGPGPFNRLVHSAQMRQKFAHSAMQFLRCYHLDGIDIDWEFPNFPNHFGPGRDHERLGLTKIFMELRAAIVEDFFNRQVSEQQQHLTSMANNNGNIQINGHSNNNGNCNDKRRSPSYCTKGIIPVAPEVEAHLLTLAIGAQEPILRASYELKNLAHLCDWFNVMSYDYYLFKPYAPFTGPNSPLRPIVDSYVPVLGKLSFQSTISRLLAFPGVPAHKIVMGIPTYARAYRLLFKNSHPAPFRLAYGSKPGQVCDDHLDYHEVLELLARPDTITYFDERARVPYLLTDDGYTWVSYENEQSVQEKLETILEYKLGGYMTWNLNCDFQSSNSSQVTLTSEHDTKTNNIINNNNIDRPATGSFPLHRRLYETSGKSTLSSGNNDNNKVT